MKITPDYVEIEIPHLTTNTWRFVPKDDSILIFYKHEDHWGNEHWVPASNPSLVVEILQQLTQSTTNEYYIQPIEESKDA